MKKKILIILVLFITISCFYSLLFPYTAKADDMNMVNQISITQNPIKTTYARGESLDLTGMIVEGYYYDGTRNIISGYDIAGYDCNQFGVQTVFIEYQNYSATLNITVIPAKVTNISASSHSTTSLTLTWDALADVTGYEIYSLDDTTGTYSLTASTESNRITLSYLPGTIHSYQICTIGSIAGIEYRGEFSDTFTAATDPDMVIGLTVVDTTTSSISLSWDEVAGATGYIIYRSPVSTNSTIYCQTTTSTFYTDSRLSSGQSFNYKVCAYTLNVSHSGSSSSIVETSTNPAKMVVNTKAGDQKIRITWAKVTGASSYDIYIGDDNNGYSLLTTNTGNSSVSFIADGLTTGKAYSFYTIARRNYKGVIYDSPASKRIGINLVKIKDTSTTGKNFATKSGFIKSWAYTRLAFFEKNVKYSKSIIIPGLITTNIGGFSSTSMCPQGITFAEDYLLLTAYDIASKENSVIYVMDKSSKKLLTTLILPSKTHAGGISYDGSNIWIPTGTKISSVPFSEVEIAVQKGVPYSYIKYNTTSTIGINASYVTYYDNKLWVGSYNELKSTNMYSYIIENKHTAPSLAKTDTIIMPTRVQGIAFTSIGTLILSRSCQLYKGLRGYIRQLDVYKPAFSKGINGILPLGKRINSVDMPSMNEGIAVNGSYLYVNFESSIFARASYKMDRICAFKLTSVTKKISPKK